MTSYDVFQQTFGMSIASNAAGAGVGTQELYRKCSRRDSPHSSHLTANGLPSGDLPLEECPRGRRDRPRPRVGCIAQPRCHIRGRSVHDTYVVAIAGTATFSQYDWTDVNLRVGTLVDFDTWVAAGVKDVPDGVTLGTPTVSYVSIGAALAVQKLFTIAAPAGVAGAGTNLYDFFAGLGTSGPSRIIFTGHSLGAALSPTLALASVKSNIIPPSTNLRVYMTAGPSPGNGPFVTAFSATFPPMNVGTTYQVWNQNIYNTLDVVPQAWCTVPVECPDQNTSKIPGMYGIPGPKDVQDLINGMNFLIGGTQVVYKPMPGRSFPGVPSGLPMPTTIEEFLFAALLQHEPPYNVYIGVPAASKHETLGHGVAKKTLKQVLYSSTVLGELAVWGEHIEEIRAMIAAKSG
ncbi:hypothetical protein BD779DRAFT_1002757 [Infundibulicybe gibba]|nr:hypothetical protein BD779DRAFT_1002757 [Infundibulicybe gibba]